MKQRVHFSSKDYALFEKNNAMDSFAYFCQMKAAVQYNVITVDQATQSLKISRATLYRHLKVLAHYGYIKRLKSKAIILKGSLTKGAYKNKRFSLTKIPNRKRNQPVHMSVRIGKNTNETKKSLNGLKIVSNILKQTEAIQARAKAASSNKNSTIRKNFQKRAKDSTLTKGGHLGFVSISNQSAARLTGKKSKQTGQNNLRKLSQLGYFDMKQAFVSVSFSKKPQLKGEVLSGHPAYRYVEKKVGNKIYFGLVRQVGNEISQPCHTCFGYETKVFKETQSHVFAEKGHTTTKEFRRLDRFVEY